MAKLSVLLPLLIGLCLIKLSVLEDPNLAIDCENIHLLGSKTAYSELLAACLAKDNELFGAHSLEESHKELVDEQGCKPVALYLIGRHAARQPGLEEIDQITGNLEGKFGGSQFSKWRSPFLVEQADLVTTLGASAQRDIAHRLARIYPEFFDENHAHVELATTSKLRTIQSGIEFAKEVANFRVKKGENSDAMCALRNNPDDFECGGRAAEHDLKCLESILPQYFRIQLEFHKVCKRKVKQTKSGVGKKSAQLRLNQDDERSKAMSKIGSIQSMVLNEMAAEIKEKLSLEVTPPTKTIASAYAAFVYETSAIYGDQTKSIWHNLFDRKHAEALEYLDDAKIYHKLAANRDSFAIQSSPLFKDLLNKLTAAAAAPSDSKPRAYFGFTHDGVLKKFFAALGFFDDDKQAGYSLVELEAFEQSRVVPKRRLWRASLMAPFSGNIQFALYKCPASVIGDQFKLLTSIAEWPVRVKGCSGPVCPLGNFLATYNTLQQYSDEQVCESVRKLMDA